MSNERPDAYITVYMPIAGWKAVMLTVDEECGGMHTPWETGDCAFATKAEAVADAKQWAGAEEIPFFDDCPKQVDDAPDKSVTEQLQELIPGIKVVTLGE
jgi:hypothetical protein